MSADKDWFKIDRKGLAKLVMRRGEGSGGIGWFAAMLFELISNAFDANGTTRVTVTVAPEEGVPKAWVTVTDDAPDGFADLTHSYTVFAESSRKAHAEKRGRFNLGEKLVLAMCDEASIVTTTGGVMFDHRGRTTMKAKRGSGSEFAGLVRVTRQEMHDAIAALRKVLVPGNVTLIVNGETIRPRPPIKTFAATLPTEIADEEGNLRRSRRKTTVRVYVPNDDEPTMLYEMGIPVVETSDKWHVEVDQKIPLNMDRDNVTPAFLRELRTAVVNEMHEQLNEGDAAATFVNEALADKNATPEAVSKALDLKYGTKRAIWDPTDLEANNNLVAQGYTLIKGSQLTKEQWHNVKSLPEEKRPLPSGQIKPTRKAEFSPDGEDNWVHPDKYTLNMRAVVAYTKRLAGYLLDTPIDVNVLSNVRLPYAACFGSQGFTFNLGRLGHRFFDACYDDGGGLRRPSMKPTVQLNQLIIHELGHHIQSNHLDERYHEALCNLGAKMVAFALTQPELFLEAL